MKIKQKPKVNKAILDFIKPLAPKRKWQVSIILVVLILLATPIAILETQSSFYAYQKAKVIVNNSFQIISNYFSSFSSSPDSMDISIKDTDLKRLNYIKELSLKHYIGLDNQDSVSLMRKEWIPARLSVNNKTYDINMRVKGQSVDHWGKYGSYKFKVKGGETIFGMKRFALQHPKVRGFMNDWYFHKFLKFNGLINLRYDFISLSINGEYQTIYALEENFGKRLLEHNNRKEGLIFRINNTVNNRVSIQQPDSELEAPYLNDGIDLLSQNIDLFFAGKLSVAEVFNIQDLARFYAIIDLWGNRHAGQLKNIRFYFNPSTLLVETIGYDQQALYPLQYLNLLGLNRDLNSNSKEQSDFFNLIFNDKEFYKVYIAELNRIANEKLLKSFILEIEEEKQEKLKTLYKSFPYFESKSKYPSLFWNYQDIKHTRFDSSLWLPTDIQTLFNNQEYIKNSLKLNAKSVLVKLEDYDYDERLVILKVYNNEQIPLDLKELNLGKNNSIKIKNPSLVQPKNIIKQKGGNLFEIKIPPEIDFKLIKDNTMNVTMSILGLTDDFTFDVIMPIEFIPVNSINNPTKLNEIEFIRVDKSNNIITILKGNHVIDQSIIFPAGFTIEANAGTSIKLLNGASLISYSPLNFIGSEMSPIKISSDMSGGVAILNTKKVSEIEYIEFDNLNSILQKGANISGGVNFYEADINLRNCLFRDINSEDAINIVRSNFVIDKCNFINSKSDAIDADFSEGKLSNLFFENTGNDAIDISTGILDVENVVINLTGDKGISIGENSFATLDRLQISKAKIGVAVKDKSKVYIGKQSTHKNLIDDCEIGFAVYQKKSEFGPAELHIGDPTSLDNDLILTNTKTHFVLEKNSFLKVGDQELTNFKEDVFKQIYN
ncbi:CotH kinase family protein [Candidatus Thioglobus sp.]|nr:CotH kinase family protein [Candidatus Thioglobus sp.]